MLWQCLGCWLCLPGETWHSPGPGPLAYFPFVPVCTCSFGGASLAKGDVQDTTVGWCGKTVFFPHMCPLQISTQIPSFIYQKEETVFYLFIYLNKRKPLVDRSWMDKTNLTLSWNSNTPHRSSLKTKPDHKKQSLHRLAWCAQPSYTSFRNHFHFFFPLPIHPCVSLNCFFTQTAVYKAYWTQCMEGILQLEPIYVAY